MNICTILDLDCLSQALNQLPKLALHVILGLLSSAVEDRVERHLWSEVVFFEVVGFFLKLLQRVDATFFEPVLSCANKAFRAMPIVVRNAGQRWIEAVLVVSELTAVASNDRIAILGLATVFAFLRVIISWHETSPTNSR